MTILSKVCAEFCDQDTGKVIYRVQEHQIMAPLPDVPEAIQQDPLFGWLVKSEMMQVVQTKEEMKRAENNPEKAVSSKKTAEKEKP